MDSNPIWNALIGGVLIGVASGAFLFLNGRIAGISGVVGGLLRPARGDVGWRVAFVVGLIVGGIGFAALRPSAFPSVVSASTTKLVVAGLLVGFGTRLGGGCTSGHGVCGMARLSPRSIVATLVFILTGAVTVFVLTHLGGS